MLVYVGALTDRLIIINNNDSYIRIPPWWPSMLVHVGALTDRLIIINNNNSYISTAMMAKYVGVLTDRFAA